MGKKCSKCGVDKPLEEYYVANSKKGFGRRRECKSCHLLVRRTEEFRVGARKRLKKWKSKNPGAVYKSVRKWRDENREKLRAHSLVNYALKVGKITKERCVECGSKAEAHHPDYGKPYEVIWLCRKHHSEKHLLLKI